MQISDFLSYYFRYLIGPLLFLIALLLLVRMWRILRLQMKISARPATYFFLLRESLKDESFSPVRLFHTNLIGSSGSADMRIRDKGVRRRHAQLYLYDGSWFLEPVTTQTLVWVNGKQIEERTEIVNNDVIGLGTTKLTLVDDRKYLHEDNDSSSIEYLTSSTGGQAFSTLILLHAFYAICMGLLLYTLPEEFIPHRGMILIYSVIVIIFSDLVFALFKITLKQFNVDIFLAVMALYLTGFIIQSRFSFWDLRASSENLESAIQARVSGWQQICFIILVGLAMALILSLIVANTRLLEKLGTVAMIGTTLLLLITLIFGRGQATHGAGLWIYIGSRSIQLTEFAKVGWLIVLASFFKTRPPLKVQIRFAVWAGVNFVLLLLLPDLGSAMILLPVTLIVFTIMTSEYLLTGLVLAVGAGASLIAYQSMPYVQRRIFGWISLWEEVNPQNSQIVYALQAVSRGGAIGQGLTRGSPRAIPLASEDMVFSIVCEEMGLIAGFAIIILFFVIWLAGITSVVKGRDGFSASLTLALTTAFFMEAIIAIGGTTGLIPLTGITLPFIAHGGSSLLAKFLMLGLLLGVSARREKKAYRKAPVKEAEISLDYRDDRQAY
ncbi:MAG TPA: FtsW/RodA/SpoVE family cell cycle protein [Clostridiaceae bacterium]|nr:FtsW/RodA/SpoVE family cell cycle protein [Clostridiaceae bacterium]